MDHPVHSPTIERWKHLRGQVDRYLISSFGRVLSYNRFGCNGQGATFMKPPIFLKPSVTADGRAAVGPPVEGRSVPVLLHRLVAEAFLPNPLNKPEVNHLDGNPLNNAVSNLEWATKQENLDHMYDVLKRRSRMGPDLLAELRTLKAFGARVCDLAQMFGLSYSRVFVALRRS